MAVSQKRSAQATPLRVMSHESQDVLNVTWRYQDTSTYQYLYENRHSMISNCPPSIFLELLRLVQLVQVQRRRRRAVQIVRVHVRRRRRRRGVGGKAADAWHECLGDRGMDDRTNCRIRNRRIRVGQDSGISTHSNRRYPVTSMVTALLSRPRPLNPLKP